MDFRPQNSRTIEVTLYPNVSALVDYNISTANEEKFLPNSYIIRYESRGKRSCFFQFVIEEAALLHLHEPESTSSVWCAATHDGSSSFPCLVYFEPSLSSFTPPPLALAPLNVTNITTARTIVDGSAYGYSVTPLNTSANITAFLPGSAFPAPGYSQSDSVVILYYKPPVLQRK